MKLMKKILLSAILVLGLTMIIGCGQDISSAPGFSADDLYLNIQEAQYRLNADIETVIAALGTDYEYSEGRSCDYDGLDKTFLYDDAEFYTWPMTQGDLVNEIYTKSPAVTTSKGIAVGASKEEVLAVYGEECEDTGYQIIYRLPDSQNEKNNGALCFDLENGAVIAIYITAQAV